MLLFIAQEIWSAVVQTYSQDGNDAQAYKLEMKVLTKQGERKLPEYYAEVRILWQENDFCKDFQANCGQNAKKYQSKVEKNVYSTSWQVLIQNLIKLVLKFLEVIRFPP